MQRKETAQPTNEVADLLGPRAIPNLKWLTNVSGREESAVLAAIQELVDLLRFEKSIERTLERSGRNYYAQFPAPLDLYVLTRLSRPRHALESGVSSGLSSAHMLMGLDRNKVGSLHSIDFPQYQRAAKRRRGELSWSIPPGKDSGWAIPPRLKHRWDFRKGRSEDVLPEVLAEIPAVDLFCHDSPWTPQHLAFELETVRPKLHSGSIVVADNANVNPKAVRNLAAQFSTKVFHRGHNSSLIGIRIP